MSEACRRGRRPPGAIVALLLLSALLASCGKSPSAEGRKARPQVAVSILPQAWFVERIGGGRVEVITLIGAGQSPHSYDPSPRQVQALSRCAAWFRIGVEFEQGLAERIAALAPGMLVADCTVGMAFRSLEDGHGHEDDGGAVATGEDAPGGRDPHVWLGRSQSQVMAKTIAATLATLDPSSSLSYHQAAAELIREIEGAFDGLSTRLAPLRGSSVFVFHPSFGYFLDEFGIRQEAVEVGGKEPSQRQLAALVERAKSSGARVVFVQAQFSDRAARAVAAAIGGTVLPLDPLAKDWMGNLSAMGEALASALPRAGGDASR